MGISIQHSDEFHSGDDHDYCEYVHTVPVIDTKRPSPPLSVPEITVKSFSMAMGIRRPGYQLLSLVPPSSGGPSPTFAHQPCLLPDQLAIYLNVYIPFLLLTLVVLLAVNIGRVLSHHATASIPTRSGDAHAIPLASTAGDVMDYDLPPPSPPPSGPLPPPPPAPGSVGSPVGERSGGAGGYFARAPSPNSGYALHSPGGSPAPGALRQRVVDRTPEPEEMRKL